eukprot:178106-Chlamydomonas_euryale.AAC.4
MCVFVWGGVGDSPERACDHRVAIMRGASGPRSARDARSEVVGSLTSLGCICMGKARAVDVSRSKDASAGNQMDQTPHVKLELLQRSWRKVASTHNLQARIIACFVPVTDSSMQTQSRSCSHHLQPALLPLSPATCCTLTFTSSTFRPRRHLCPHLCAYQRVILTCCACRICSSRMTTSEAFQDGACMHAGAANAPSPCES